VNLAFDHVPQKFRHLAVSLPTEKAPQAPPGYAVNRQFSLGSDLRTLLIELVARLFKTLGTAEMLRKTSPGQFRTQVRRALCRSLKRDILAIYFTDTST
jgi:hypothetical protein